MAYAFKLPDGSLTRDVALVRATNSAANQISTLKSTANYNNAYSASQAKIQRDWQEQQNAKAMTFNAQQAALNRDWQQMMSNTAHQREIKDLQAAGLNPVLSAMNGNGAAVTSGATASGVTSAGAKGETDMSMNSALVNLLGSIYNRTTQLEAANINARTQEAVAEKYNATSRIVANIAADATRYASDANKYRSYYEFGKNGFNDIKTNLIPFVSDVLTKPDNSGISAIDVAKNGLKKVKDWWNSTEKHYDYYKRYGADNMSFGDLTSALVGAVKSIF